MTLTRLALGNPVAAAVAVLLVLLFGSIALTQIPVQMIPTVVIPRITINTAWRAAAPDEVESEIIEVQEDVLRGVPGVEQMVSTATQGQATVTLTFDVGMSVERALIEVMNRLNQVPRYPADATEPVLVIGSSMEEGAAAWFTLRVEPGNPNHIDSYLDFVEEVIQTRFERVNGVATAGIFGGRESEIRITFDPYKAAALDVQLPAVVTLAGNNVDTTGGFTDIGRRQYTVRYAGQYAVSEFEDMVLAWRDGNAVRLGDVAAVERRLVDQTIVLTQNGEPAIGLNIQPEEGVNILEVLANVREAAQELREGPLAREGLVMLQVFDETDYINESIAALRNNLLLGVALAVGILWWFLRRFKATLVIAAAIPISLFFSFFALNLGGRTINIVSLAALAFAMGMVLDASIVVLENIVRLRENGERSSAASVSGAQQVWGALLASTVTTVAIFLPILFLRDFAAQIFADLAFAISVAIIVSLFIAIGVVPTAAHSWLRHVNLHDPHRAWWEWGTRFVMRATDTPRRRYSWIAGLVLTAASVTWLLLPPADYLPEGRQNWIFAFMLPPPGQSVEAAKTELVDVIAERISPYQEGEKEPAVNYYFAAVMNTFGFVGVSARNAADVDDILAIFNAENLAGFPDTLAFANRVSVFSRVEGARSIELNIHGENIDTLLSAAQIGMGLIAQAIPGAQVRPDPGVELAQPELRLIPDERRIAEVGWSRNVVANIARALGDGLFVGEYFDGIKKRNIVVRALDWDDPEELAAIPLATPQGGVVPAGELMRIERTVGADQIRRVDRRRTITLIVTPPSDLSLEEALTTLRSDVAPALLAHLPADGELSFYGSADDLEIALGNMGRSFLLAIVILYLLVSALFRSFRDSLLVLLVLPLATVGGVVALRITDLMVFQPMDLLTMIGFITLLGLVVNNAILLVYQTRTSERAGASRRDAVEKAVRIRLRPILMSTLTSLFGMLPLLVIPGAGTELYRGMAAVIVGGMSVSTAFTLILLPSLLRLGEERQGVAIGDTLTGGIAVRQGEGS
ncbi:MAG: efflux RND transporter permease subunit [Proteobacteria bacterium]|nr:efflux RND transporter permease subunit [Pseudomonadota bacterium]